MDNKKNITDTNELLIRIDERLKAIEAGFSNHLKHHWAITTALLAAVLGLVAKMIWL